MLTKIASAAAGLAVLLAAGSVPARADGSYGAIATSSGYYGLETNADSEHEAERMAVRRCQGAVRAAGANEKCVARVWFTKCGAVVQNDRYVAWGTGNTEHEAIHAAYVKMDHEGKIYAKACNG